MRGRMRHQRCAGVRNRDEVFARACAHGGFHPGTKVRLERRDFHRGTALAGHKEQRVRRIQRARDLPDGPFVRGVEHADPALHFGRGQRQA